MDFYDPYLWDHPLQQFDGLDGERAGVERVDRPDEDVDGDVGQLPLADGDVLQPRA